MRKLPHMMKAGESTDSGNKPFQTVSPEIMHAVNYEVPDRNSTTELRNQDGIFHLRKISRVISPFPGFFSSLLPVRKGKYRMPATPRITMDPSTQPVVFSHFATGSLFDLSSTTKGMSGE
jgi:hypothetical protein